MERAPMGSTARQVDHSPQSPELLARKRRMHALLARGAPIEAVLDALAGLQFEERKLPPVHPVPRAGRRRRRKLP
jgi:hypothetical protein